MFMFPCLNRHLLALFDFGFVISVMKYPFGPKIDQIGDEYQKVSSLVFHNKLNSFNFDYLSFEIKVLFVLLNTPTLAMSIFAKA